VFASWRMAQFEPLWRRAMISLITAAGRETWVTPASFFIGAAKREGRQK